MPKTTAKYVDGFVLVVPKNKLAEYKKMAAGANKVWKKYGALEYKECVADDPRPKGVTLTFPKAYKAKPSEVIIFSYITYKSRAHRDQVNAKVMKDPAMNDPKYENMPMPFDMKRMSFGGFKVIVSS